MSGSSSHKVRSRGEVENRQNTRFDDSENFLLRADEMSNAKRDSSRRSAVRPEDLNP